MFLREVFFVVGGFGFLLGSFNLMNDSWKNVSVIELFFSCLVFVGEYNIVWLNI